MSDYDSDNYEYDSDSRHNSNFIVEQGEYKDRERTEKKGLLDSWESLNSTQYREKNIDPKIKWKSTMKKIILDTLSSNINKYNIYIRNFEDYINNATEDIWKILLNKNNEFIILSYLFKNLPNKQDRIDIINIFFDNINSNNKTIRLEPFNIIDILRYKKIWDVIG